VRGKRSIRDGSVQLRPTSVKRGNRTVARRYTCAMICQQVPGTTTAAVNYSTTTPSNHHAGRTPKLSHSELSFVQPLVARETVRVLQILLGLAHMLQLIQMVDTVCDCARQRTAARGNAWQLVTTSFATHSDGRWCHHASAYMHASCRPCARRPISGAEGRQGCRDRRVRSGARVLSSGRSPVSPRMSEKPSSWRRARVKFSYASEVKPSRGTGPEAILGCAAAHIEFARQSGARS
jgi:hypothetical protein